MDNKTLAGIIAVCVVAILICSYIFMPNNNSENEELEGTWHQIYYEVYRDGTYESTNTEDIDVDKYTIEIKDEKDGVFTGLFKDSPVSGTYVDGMLKFYGVYGGIKSYLTGYIDSKIMYASFSEVVNNESRVVFAAYSKDSSTQYKAVDAMDIKGDWKAYEAVRLAEGAVKQLSGENVKITQQDGMLFKGTQEQVVGNKIVPLDFNGVFFYEKTSGYVTAMFYVAGENWMLYTDGNDLIMCTTMESVITGTIGDVVVVDRQYSRDGAEIKSEILDLEGTTWKSTKSKVAESAASESKIIDNPNESILTFDLQNGRMVTGNVSHMGKDCAVRGFIFGDSVIMAYVCDGVNIHVVGTIDEGTLTTTAWEFEDGKYISTVTTY